MGFDISESYKKAVNAMKEIMAAGQTGKMSSEQSVGILLQLREEVDALVDFMEWNVRKETGCGGKCSRCSSVCDGANSIGKYN